MRSSQAVAILAIVALPALGMLGMLGVTTPAAASTLVRAELLGHQATGDQPTAIRLMDDGRRLAVVNRGDSTIDVYDAESLEPVQHYPVTSIGHGAWDVVELTASGELLVSNWVGEHVTIFDTVSGEVRTLIPTGIKPSYVALSRDGGSAYVAGSLTGDVTLIDLATRAPRRTIEVGQRPMGVAVSPDGRFLYVAACGSNLVAKIDLKHEVVLEKFGTPLAETTNVVVTPDGRHVLVAGDHGRLLVLDADDGDDRKIAIGGDLAAVALSPDGATAYVAVYDRNEIAVVDLASGSVTDRLATGPGPIALAVTADRLWSANDQADAITAYRFEAVEPVELPSTGQ